MPIIILEGVDGSGKSTLAKQICDASPILVRMEHRGVPLLDVKDEYLTPLDEVKDDELFLADRWHLGELIYGPLYRGSSQLMWNPNVLAAVSQKLNELKFVGVVLAPPLEVVQKRLTVRGEDYLKPEDVEKVYNEYLRVGEIFDFRVIRNVTDTLASDLVAEALR